MNKRCPRFLLAGCVVAIVSFGTPAQAQSPRRVDDQREAAEVRSAEAERRVEVARQLQVERQLLAEKQLGPKLAGFSVVLVQGDLNGTSTAEGVPPAAAKALADLKDFLPYKGYQLLDSQWTMGNDRVLGKLARPGGAYEFELQARLSGTAVVSVSRFALRETDGQTGARGSADQSAPSEEFLRFQLEAAARRHRDIRTKFEIGVATKDELDLAIFAEKALESRLRASSRPPDSSVPVIDTSFTMDLGETVVVGTSRLQGSRALIVLLTAVAR